MVAGERIVLALLLFLVGTGVALAGHSSSFGANWSEQGTDVLPDERNQHSTVVFNDEIYVIGGTDSPGTEKQTVYASSDGTVWAEKGTNALPATRALHCSVVFDTKVWVIAGQDSGNTVTDNVYSSSDGETWSEEGTDAFPVDIIAHACAVKDAKIWVFGGTVGGNAVATVYSSSDGETWSEEGTNALPQALEFASVAVLNDAFYLIGGRDSSDVTQNEVYRSTDGQTWTQVGTLPAVRQLSAAVAAEGRLWVMGGFTDTTFDDTVFSSLDGETWIESGNGALPATVRQHGAAFFLGKLFTTGGRTTGGTVTQKVYATDQVAGAVELTRPSDTASQFANEIPAIDQSGDVASGSLPVVGPVAQDAEDTTGWPVVDLVFTLIFGAIACLVAFALSRLAPDNKLVTAIGVMIVLAIGFVVGQGLIEWYVLLAIGGLMFGITSLGSALQG